MAEPIPAHEFMEACVSTVRGLGRRNEVRLVFQGNQALTDGNTVIIPALDQSKPVMPEQQVVTRGYIDHEAGHVRHSDMPLFQEESAAAQERGDSIFQMFLNAVEDVRMEGCVTSEYPGSLKNLEFLQEAVLSAGVNELSSATPAQLADWRVVGPLAICLEGFKHSGYEAPSHGKVSAMIPPDLLKRAQEWAVEIGKLPRITERDDPKTGDIIRDGKPGTAAAIELAKEIVSQVYTKMAGTAPPKLPPQIPGTRNGGASNASGSGSSSTYSVTSGASTPEPTSPGGGVGSSSGPSHLGVEDVREWSKDIKPISSVFEPQKQLKSITGESKGAYRAFSTADDKEHTRHDRPGKYLYQFNSGKTGKDMSRGLALQTEEGRQRFLEIRHEIKGAQSVMQRKLANALMDKLKRGWKRHESWGRFDRRAMVGAVRGKDNVFARRDMAPALNTAVCMLVDMSGSMKGGKIELAERAAISLAEAMDRVSVPFEVLGFNCMHNFNSEKLYEEFRAQIKGGHKFHRHYPLDHYVFKSYSDKLRDCHHAMGAIAQLVGGDNCDGESFNWAWRRLRRRPEKKKVMLVLSDGYPATQTSYDEMLNVHLRASVLRAEKEAHVVGIGICSDAVKQFYSRWTVLNDMADLPKSVLDNVARAILGERFVIDSRDLIAIHGGEV
jgi:cobalamin biosynthesis protein CobT